MPPAPRSRTQPQAAAGGRARLLAAGLALVAGFPAVAGPFVHFEARLTHPVELAPDGRSLLGVNPLEGRLARFTLAGAARDQPVLADEIPVGLGPVAVRLRTADEAWVVNEVSDSISVVSLSRRMVLATLPCPDEPADVVFAGTRAFVSCARNGVLRVFDTSTRLETRTVPLAGVQPRALALAPDGSQVWAAFLNSGNGTTVLPTAVAPAPETPWNPALGPAPATARIVDAQDPRVRYTVLDHDVAVVPVADSGQVRYLGGLGTSIFTVTSRPGTEEVWAGVTEAHNRLRYEPRLKGRFISNRLARHDTAGGLTTAYDLSPFDDEGRPTGREGREGALAQPMALAFAPDGRELWIAAFASDRVARISAADGSVLARVDLRGAGEGSDRMRGPRGLAWNPATERLYVLNLLSSTVSTIDTGHARVIAESRLGSGDPLSPDARAGRGLLFDARLSGNGASACGSCHLDADLDGLAWDLGDPGGSMTEALGADLAIHDPTPRRRSMHPMKGPMVTQTLRGLDPAKRLHWRGDRPTLRDFDSTFRDLLGGELQGPTALDHLAAYLATLRHHPNPNRNPDDSLPESFRGGNAARGAKLFGAHLHHCGICHVLPLGTDHNLDDPRNLQLSQPIQTPSLHTTYQRALLDTRAGATNLSGFGLLHDGTGSSASLPTVHFYDLDALNGSQFKDVEAFVLCFDSGTAPAVGRSVTVSPAPDPSSPAVGELALLESQAARTNVCDLVLRGRFNGSLAHFLFDPISGKYLPDPPSAPVSRAELLDGLAPGDALTALAVPAGLGPRFTLDRDDDGTPDAAQPRPTLSLQAREDGTWAVSPPPPGWSIESSIDPRGPWTADLPDSSPATSQRFFRLRRTW